MARLEDELQVSLSVLLTLKEPTNFGGSSSNGGVVIATIDHIIGSCWDHHGTEERERFSLLPSEFQPWIDAWTQIGTLLNDSTTKASTPISPFELHALALQTWRSAESDSLFVSTTLLLLCCRALRQCPRNPPRLRKRWKSLLWETLQLYQRQWWDDHCSSFFQHNSNGENNRVAVLDRLRLGVSLVNQHLLPSVWHVRAELLPYEPPGNFDFAAASMACVVSILCPFHDAICRINDPGKQDAVATKLKDDILTCIDETLDGDWNLVWCHWWRLQRAAVAMDQDSNSAGLNTSLSFWSCWRQDITHEEEAEDCAESVCLARTVWDSSSISLIAATSFFSPYRPLVLHPSFSWKLFFPHIVTLLEKEDEIGDEEETGANQQLTSACQKRGFDLLNGLLNVTPLRSLSLGTPLKQYQGNRPDHPALQAFQLLSNHMIQMNVVRSEHKSSASMLPGSSSCYQLMKQLVSKYKPVYQVALVQCLVETCPHPGLKPKLLDLSRPLVAVSSSTFESNNDIGSAQTLLWQFWDRLWGEIMSTCFAEQESATTTAWGKLVDNAELCVSILSLIQLWNIVGNNKTVPTNLEHLKSESLQRLVSSLSASLQHWERLAAQDSGSRPQEHHRLFLLESTLESTIPILCACGQNS